MTDQPTDHRAEAEHWLKDAIAIWDEDRDYDDPPIDQLRIISRALIGIGHALLAALLEPPEWAMATLTSTEPDDLRDRIDATLAAFPHDPSCHTWAHPEDGETLCDCWRAMLRQAQAAERVPLSVSEG